MKKELIEKMVRAMKLEPGEVVLLNFWGEEEELDDLYAIAAAVAAVGAFPQLMLHSLTCYGKLFQNVNEAFPQKWYQQFDAADCVIDILCRAPGRMPEGLENPALYAAYLRGLFERFSQKKKLIQITMPTKENAKDAGMEFDSFYDRTVRALDVDYDVLQKSCEEKVNSFAGNIRTVRTGLDCVLTLDTTGREWYIDAGDGALPCGEIYIAPVEENTNGSIFFEVFAVEDLGVFHNVTLQIENGHIVKTSCEEFNEFLKELPCGANIVAELGIGMNPNVNRILGDSTIDENAVGTFHIAIGMNHLFGGKNVCPVHFDFVAVGDVE